MLLRAVMVFFVLTSLGGCAIGQKIDYRESSPYLMARSDTVIAVVVFDERPYVVSGSKSSTYVGTLRALYYNPFNINTLSGAPLASDLNSAIRSSMRRSSIQVVYTDQVDKAAPGQKLLTLKLSEWKSDSYMRTRFDYDITATVLDEHGKILASKNAKQTGAITNVITAGTDALGKVLNDSEIVSALGSKAAQVPSTIQKSEAKENVSYDDCMRRIARISDSALRTASMRMCDDIK